MAKILVIDDQPAIRELFSDVLVSVGHEVISAADGRMGLDLYARHRPGLVIIDLVIPGISGLELVDRLRQEPGVKIIAVSGSSVEMLKAARILGASLTLKKPFRIDQLLAAVKELVGEPPPA
jgi:CheY-like chemotaxis protein